MMHYGITRGEHTIICRLPDAAGDGRWFDVDVAGKKYKGSWHSGLRTFFLKDEYGLERTFQARSINFEPVGDDGSQTLSIELYDGSLPGEIVFGASIGIYVPGSENRRSQTALSGKTVKSPLTGKVLRILVKAGQKVSQGDELVIVEAMKMENKIFAPIAGTIDSIKASEQATVSVGQELLKIKA